MIRAFSSLALVSAFLSVSTPLFAAVKPGASEFDLRTSYQLTQDPLTLERLAIIDPAQPNPQLRWWALDRQMEIQNWVPRKLPGGGVGVQGGVMKASSYGYLRPAGPWYSSLADFPCASKSPDPLFITEHGAREQANASAKLWDEMLSANKFRLSLLMGRISAVNEKSAMSKADRVFQEWLVRLDREWRERVESEILPKQWKEEKASAEKSGFCGTKKKASAQSKAPSKPSPSPSPSIVATDVDSWLDRTMGNSLIPVPDKPLTRAPARRWQGFFAVRMDIVIGESTVLGQMLIDPASPRSVISPEWLLGQGVRPEFLEIPEADPLRVHIEAGTGQKGLASVAKVDTAKISGAPIAMSRFLLFDTSTLFDEPETIAPCCSGVLGLDFLRRYVVEFDGSKPTAVQLWATQGYRPPRGYNWVEVRENDKGELVPSCTARVRAITGWKKMCRDPRESLQAAVGKIIYDLPHGRIWYSPEELSAPEFKNLSGIKVEFTYLKGDRVLEVKSLGDAPLARQLQKSGLRKGMIITEVDGIPVTDMDLWEVNRRLSGAFGENVTLKWKTRDGYKSEPLKVIERALI